MDDQQLNSDEKYIVLSAIKCLHNLKYIADLAIISQKNHDLLEKMCEEITRIREILEDD